MKICKDLLNNLSGKLICTSWLLLNGTSGLSRFYPHQGAFFRQRKADLGQGMISDKIHLLDFSKYQYPLKHCLVIAKKSLLSFSGERRMKTLLLMRHAKSSWKDHKLTDVERPLSKRGLRAAPLMGALLQEKELVPQLILASCAVRAGQTAELVGAAAGYGGDIECLSSLYKAEPAAYIGALSVTPDEIEIVLVVGHNPALEALLQILSQRIKALPINTVAYICLPLQSWKDLDADVEGELVELITLPEGEDLKIKEKGKEKKKDKKEY